MSTVFGSATDEEKKKGKRLLEACLRGRKKIALEIIADGSANVVNHRNMHGESPIYFAAKSSFDIFKALLLRGADPFAKTGSAQTPLHQAAHAGRTDVLRFMSENTDSMRWQKHILSELKAFSGNTPAHVAASHGRYNFLEWYICTGARMNSRNAAGSNPLHMACAKGALITAATLLRHAKMEINDRLFINPRPTPFLALIHSDVPFEEDCEQFRDLVEEFLLRGGKLKGCKVCSKGKGCKPVTERRMAVVEELRVKTKGQPMRKTVPPQCVDQDAKPQPTSSRLKNKRVSSLGRASDPGASSGGAEESVAGSETLRTRSPMRRMLPRKMSRAQSSQETTGWANGEILALSESTPVTPSPGGSELEPASQADEISGEDSASEETTEPSGDPTTPVRERTPPIIDANNVGRGKRDKEKKKKSKRRSIETEPM